MNRIQIITASLTIIFFFTPAVLLSSLDKKTAAAIDAKIEKHLKDIIQMRRHLHMNPELSGKEIETSKFIASKLEALGFEVKTGVAGTGVVALLRGGQDGPTVAIRADMDALPIEEKTGLEFESRNKGVMHACGHDIHMSVGLGTAYVLSELRDRIKGNVKFIFQPAEEGMPGDEEGGASLMIEEGVLENPPVRAIFGLHVWPDTAGEVFFSEGPIMANSTSFKITVKGRNSHGARPHEGVDAIVLASQIVLALQTVVSRTTDPTDTAVLTVGKINGGTRSNVIADETVIEGTVRTHSESNRTRIPKLMEDIVKGITSIFGGGYTFSYDSKLPAVSNDSELARLMLPTIKSVLGEGKIHPVKPQFISEDFSYYGRKIPGFFFFLGINTPGLAESYPLHNPKFSPDERSIPAGIKVMSHLLLDSLEHQQKSIKKPSNP